MVKPTRALIAVIGLAAAAMLAGCGGDEAEKLSTSTTSTEAKTTTTEASDDKVDEQGADQSGLPSWQRTANPFRDRIGETIEFECDPDAVAAWQALGWKRAGVTTATKTKKESSNG